MVSGGLTTGLSFISTPSTLWTVPPVSKPEMVVEILNKINELNMFIKKFVKDIEETEKIYEELNSSAEKGVDEKQVKKFHEEFGLNEIPKAGISKLKIYLAPIFNLLCRRLKRDNWQHENKLE